MNTGINQLDKDLEALFSLDTPEKIQKIHEISSRENQTINDILAVINTSALRLALALLNEESYSKLLKIINSESIPKLERAKKFVEENLKGLINHNIDLIKEVLSIANEIDDFNPFSESLNAISTVVIRSNWIIIKQDKILPAIRCVFANHLKKQVYLQSTLEWGNVLYVVERLLDGLKEDIEIVPNILNDKAQKNLLIKPKDLLSRTLEIKKMITSIEKTLSTFEKSIK